VQGSTAVLGVVHVPVSGKTYYAVAGKGAYVRDADGSTKQIHAKEFAVSDPGLVLVGSASHANPSNNTGRHVCKTSALHVQRAAEIACECS
jgi:3'(2'), 5'-bisphosphate nucleotidase